MAVSFRGFQVCDCVAKSLPMVENYMLMRELIQSSIDLYQGSYNAGGVAASSGTHDGGGCIDVAQYSDAQIDAWRLCGWTMQHRTPAQGFSHHAHGWPRGCPHLSAGAKLQAAQWEHGTNGLVSRGPILGRYPIDDWQTAYTKRSREIVAFKDDVADLAAKKVLAGIKIPTVTEIADAVLARDKIPNTYTGNPKNETVAPATAFKVLGDRTADLPDDATLKRVESKLDLLLSTLNKPA